MKKQALLDFVAFLRNLEIGPDDMFSMGTWKSNYISEREGCGTSACAVGWGILKGALPGLEFQQRPENPTVVEPRYFGIRNFLAIEAYFDLESGAGEFLFGPDRDETPKDVADRIEAYVANPEGFAEDVHS